MNYIYNTQIINSWGMLFLHVEAQNSHFNYFRQDCFNIKLFPQVIS